MATNRELNRREFLALAGAAAAGMTGGLCSLPAIGNPPEEREMTEQSLRDAIRQAIASGAKRVRIPPGTYKLGTDPAHKGGESFHLSIHGARDLEIDGTGVALIMTDNLRSDGILLMDCERVTVRGFSFDIASRSFTQGEVLATGMEGKLIAHYDVRIDSGFENDAVKFMAEATGRELRPVSFFDPKSLEWKNGIFEPRLARVEQRSADVWRLHAVPECRCIHPVAPGDRAAVAYRGRGAWTARGCRDLVFEDLTVYNSGSIAFHEVHGEGGMTLRRCIVEPRPNSRQLLSTVGGAFIHRNIRKGPAIENCRAERMHDDGTNIHGFYDRLFEEPKGDEVLVLAQYYFLAKAGDALQFVSQQTGDSLGVCEVRACEEAGRAEKDVAHSLGSTHGLLYRVRLDKKIPCRKGDAVVALDYQGNHYSIRDCRFGDSRYRGILAKGRSGLIESNRISGCAHHAICLSPQPFSESGFVRDITVRGNEIRHVGMMARRSFGVGIDLRVDNSTRALAKPTSRPLHENVTIEENTVSDTLADGIYIANARNVKIVGNRIEKTGARILEMQTRDRQHAYDPKALRVLDSEGVVEKDNVIREIRQT